MYIRTKDGVYNTIHLTSKMLEHYKTDIINQSENLEELCDEFVIVRNGERPTILLNYDNLSLLKARVVKDNQKVYGAIWTSKGLIYVAKMNENGDLELI